MKIWLDDVRDPPDEDWIHVYTPEEATSALEGGRVVELSLDHDLGLAEPDGRERTGYDVLVFIERELALGTITFPIPTIRIHSANSVGRRRMEQAIASIQRLHQGRNPS